MEIGAIIAAVASAIVALVKLFVILKPKIERKVDDEKRNDIREAVATGDVVAVNNAVDKLCEKSGNPSGQSDDQDIARRLAKITGK